MIKGLALFLVVATFWGVLMLVMWGVWSTGRAAGYCEGKYGPGTKVEWTGTFGTSANCELSHELAAVP